jgi:2-polyprenyl-3-methyl-5-hydroxy-6-metoxy-1,4-benzoquinol methylase
MNKKIIEYRNRSNFASEMLDKYFKQAPNSNVSDIGSGFGFMENKIVAIGGIWMPFDYVKKIDKSIIWDLNNPCPVAEKAGIAIFLEVLEHLSNPELGIRNISNHINKDGFLIMSVPNPSWSRNRLHMLLKGTLFSFQPKHLEEHHVFVPWFHVVEYFLKENGFELLEYAIINEPSNPKNIKEWIKKMIQKFIESKDVKAKGLSYGIVARKL